MRALEMGGANLWILWQLERLLKSNVQQDFDFPALQIDAHSQQLVFFFSFFLSFFTLIRTVFGSCGCCSADRCRHLPINMIQPLHCNHIESTPYGELLDVSNSSGMSSLLWDLLDRLVLRSFDSMAGAMNHGLCLT